MNLVLKIPRFRCSWSIRMEIIQEAGLLISCSKAWHSYFWKSQFTLQKTGWNWPTGHMTSSVFKTNARFMSLWFSKLSVISFLIRYGIFQLSTNLTFSNNKLTFVRNCQPACCMWYILSLFSHSYFIFWNSLFFYCIWELIVSKYWKAYGKCTGYQNNCPTITNIILFSE